MLFFHHNPRKTHRMLVLAELRPLPWVTFIRPTEVSFVSYDALRDATIECFAYIGNAERFFYMANTRFGVDFVNVRLSEDDKPGFAKWCEQHQADIATYLESFVTQGYKISLNQDNKNDCFIVSITGSDDMRINRNLCMTSRSHDLLDAMLLMVFKVIVVCNEGPWGSPDTQGSSWG